MTKEFFVTLGLLLSLPLFAQEIEQAPNFSLPSVNQEIGECVDLSGVLAKHPVVLVNFFNSWCVPCRKEFPVLLKIYNEFKSRGVEFISVATTMGEENALKILVTATEFKIPWPVVFDNYDEARPAYFVERVPTNCILFGDRLISYCAVDDFSDENDLRDLLNKALDGRVANSHLLPFDGRVPPVFRGFSPWIGTTMLDLGWGGAFVSTIYEGGPAERAGLRPWDGISHVDGVQIFSSAQLLWKLMTEYAPGDTITFDVLRKSENEADPVQRLKLHVVVEPFP